MPTSAPNALDVRPLPSRRKSATVLAAFDRLEGGESFVLVDDHDPDGVRSYVEARRPGLVQWDALRDGPRVWHIEITRRSRPGVNGTES
jgi:uncharacterized protein (DUF2249 family)